MISECCATCDQYEENDNNRGTCELWIMNVEAGSEACGEYVSDGKTGVTLIITDAK